MLHTRTKTLVRRIVCTMLLAACALLGGCEQLSGQQGTQNAQKISELKQSVKTLSADVKLLRDELDALKKSGLSSQPIAAAAPPSKPDEPDDSKPDEPPKDPAPSDITPEIRAKDVERQTPERDDPSYSSKFIGRAGKEGFGFRCAKGRALTHLAGQTKDSVVAIGVGCSVLDGVEGKVWNSRKFGRADGESFDTHCPSEFVTIGLRIHTDDQGIRGLRLLCRKQSLGADRRIIEGETFEGDLVGLDVGDVTDLACRADQMATGISGAFGPNVQSLRVECDRLGSPFGTLSYNPGRGRYLFIRQGDGKRTRLSKGPVDKHSLKAGTYTLYVWHVDDEEYVHNRKITVISGEHLDLNADKK